MVGVWYQPASIGDGQYVVMLMRYASGRLFAEPVTEPHSDKWKLYDKWSDAETAAHIKNIA